MGNRHNPTSATATKKGKTPVDSDSSESTKHHTTFYFGGKRSLQSADREREHTIRDCASFGWQLGWAWCRQLFPLEKLWRSLRARMSIALWPSAGKQEAEAMPKPIDDEKIRTVSVSWPVHPALDEIIQELEDKLELKPDSTGM